MKRAWIFWVFVVLGSGCIEPFDPPVSKKEAGFLVVEGFLNATDHTVNIKLSRAIPLSEKSTPLPELGATLAIEESSGASYPVQEFGNGFYSASSPAFTINKEFRLYIRTKGNNEYRSAYVLAKHSPPIDSVSWVGEEEGVNIKVSTHDDENQTHYYRWEFTETWKYHAPYSSDWALVEGVPHYRSTEELIYTCYKDERSENILTYGTLGLAADQVSQYELNFIPRFSQKISSQYSILVKQYALGAEAYDYWQQLKVSTENLGGLFDPQPSRVKGNLSNIRNDEEPVIGYFDASGVSQQRIFIKVLDLPDHLQKNPNFNDCFTAFIPLDSVDVLPNVYLLTSGVYEGPVLVGFNLTTVPCADCRVQGGTLTRPDYWPQ